MTHAESQDLLLDLAYGELDAARAAELSEHLAGCVECQREKSALDEARRLAAPLRELEEPSAGFDERILQAARAQAKIDHGTVGQVIEVSGSVRPLGLEPTRVDAHAAPPVRERRKPRWAMRVALGGSVAAAAALALVVSTTLQSKHAAERSAQLALEKPLEIHVAPVQQAVNEAAKEQAEQMRAAAAMQQAREEQYRRASAPAKKDALALDEEKRETAGVLPKAGHKGGGLAGVGSGAAGNVAGSGGDSANVLQGVADGKALAMNQPARDQLAPPPPAPATAAAQPAASTSLPALAAKSAPVPASSGSAGQKKAAAPMERAAAPSGAVVTAPRYDDQAPAAAKMAEAPLAQRSDPQLDALLHENEAQKARLAGDYLRAATLYQQAAAMRRAVGERSGLPAWDLAHAVECLAAAGQFDQAQQVRAQLQHLHPYDNTAFAAAKRALREVDGAAAAEPPPAASPPAKAKSEPSRDATVPVEF